MGIVLVHRPLFPAGEQDKAQGGIPTVLGQDVSSAEHYRGAAGVVISAWSDTFIRAYSRVPVLMFLDSGGPYMYQSGSVLVVPPPLRAAEATTELVCRIAMLVGL